MRNHSEVNYLLSATRDIERIDAALNIGIDSRVLDVGCAAGRLALPLLDYLDAVAGGSYDGFDIQKDRISWAQANIGSRYANVHFTSIDVASPMGNPTGAVAGDQVTFPYDDGQFDIIVGYSVLPHTVGNATWRYLAEMRRCLAPTGSIYSTWFLWDDATAELVERPRDTQVHSRARWVQAHEPGKTGSGCCPRLRSPPRRAQQGRPARRGRRPRQLALERKSGRRRSDPDLSGPPDT